MSSTGVVRLPGSVDNKAQAVVGFECAACKSGKHNKCVSLRCACLRCHPARPTPQQDNMALEASSLRYSESPWVR
jgi:hypothetical protein